MTSRITTHVLDTSTGRPAAGIPVSLQVLGDLAWEELGAGTAGQIYHHVNQLSAHGWLAAHARSRYRVPAARVIPLLAILTAATGGN